MAIQKKKGVSIVLVRLLISGTTAVCALYEATRKSAILLFLLSVVVVSNDTYFFFNYSGLDLTLDTARDRLGVLPRKLIL